MNSPASPVRTIIELDPLPDFDALLWDGYLDDGSHIQCQIIENRIARIVQLPSSGPTVILDEAPILVLSDDPQEILDTLRRAFPSTVFPAVPTRPNWFSGTVSAPTTPPPLIAPRERHLVGFSLSSCICDICEGKVKEKEVLFIQCGCNPANYEQLVGVLNDYKRNCWCKYPEQAQAVFDRLWEDRDHPRVGFAHPLWKNVIPIPWGHWLSTEQPYRPVAPGQGK